MRKAQKRMLASGLTYRELGERVGICEPTIHGWIVRGIEPRKCHREAYEKAMEIIGYEPPKPRVHVGDVCEAHYRQHSLTPSEYLELSDEFGDWAEEGRSHG